MKRASFKRGIAFTCVAALLSPGAGYSSQNPGERPNILVIMTDQLTADVLGCYGGPVSTPNIDRLAREGVRFTNATCVTPFCSPSRMSLVTGRYPHSHGIVYNTMRTDYPVASSPSTEEGIKTEDITTERILHASGYHTHHYGKWHLTEDYLPYLPDMYGEHHEYAHEIAPVFREVKKRPRHRWMNWWGWSLPVEVSAPLQRAVEALGNKWEKEQYAEFITKMGRLDLPLAQVFDVRVADRTVDRIRALGPGPFMITCSFIYPHDPNVVPSPYYERFDPNKIELPPNFGQLEDRFKGDWSRRIVTDLGEPGAREFLRIYYASVLLIDEQIGRILKALQETERDRNTIIVLTTDHGDMAGRHGMIWKSTSAFYDEIVRIPFIIRYPARIKPQVSDLAASQVDIMPTLLELAGHKIPRDVQGESLTPYLLGRRGPAERRQYNFCERVQSNPEHTRTVLPGTPGSFMVRSSKWKYIRYADGGEYLYHLAQDPGEIRNLADHPSYKAEKSKLINELNDWLSETGYPRE